MASSGFRLKRIKVENFKNFEELDFELEKFNIIAGQNSSGKSNLVQIFSFLKDILNNGIADAIAYQGGQKYLLNLSSKKSVLKIEYHFSSDELHPIYNLHPQNNHGIPVFTNNVIYKFQISFKNGSYKIDEDVLEIPCSFEQEYGVKNKKIKHTAKILLSKIGKKIHFDHTFSDEAGSIIQQQYELFKYSSLTGKQLLIEAKVMGFLLPRWGELLSKLRIYNFEPNLLKLPSMLRSKSELEYNGSNLSFVLELIKRNKEKKQMFEFYTNALLPFLKSVVVDKRTDGSFRFNLEESYQSEKIPATLVSDGTANILALITCLFLQENKFTVLEEPERNIHPGLLSKILQYMNEASNENQILITTHNPMILDLVEPKNILFVSRDKKGNSTIINPTNHAMVKKFKKAMSMSELMTQNLLK